MMPYGMYYGSSMLVLIPGILLAAYASYKVNSVTRRYSRVKTLKGMCGADVARRILDHNGLGNVPVSPIGGTLTDHYNPGKKSVSLSEEVYYGNSITSIAVAAHECGHAIQDKESYAPMRFRSAIVPAVNFASSASWFIILAGFLINRRLLWIGIILFSATLLFQVVTLPVEFNASHRALIQLENLGIVTEDERYESRKVLSAAALTYVAAALTSALELLRLVLIARSND